MITVTDVAKRAGVSTSTVSHVLNRTRPVSDELRQRVLAAIEDLGYEPNAVARSLRMRRSNTLGLVISDLENPFFTAVVRGVEDVAQESGYTLILCNSNEEVARERDYIRVLLARRVDGLILSPVGEKHELLARIVLERFPLVFFDRYVPGLDVSSVGIDNEQGAYEAVRHLVLLGHRRIAMVSGRVGPSTGRDRIAGYRRALREAGIDLDDRLIAEGYSTSEGASRAVTTLLELTPRPTGLFAGNNLMTIGALAAIEDAGLSVPEDIALVGFDDFAWSEVFRPRLTTIAQPTYELGRTAAELCLRLINADRDEPTRQVTMRGQLIVRESSGAPVDQMTPLSERRLGRTRTQTPGTHAAR